MAQILKAKKRTQKPPRQSAATAREDEVLRRMLNTPPQPHKPKSKKAGGEPEARHPQKPD